MNLRKDHLHKPSVVYNDILWVLDWKAAFEAADTYTRALATGLLEVVLLQGFKRADTAEVALHASVMNVLGQVKDKDAAKCDTQCELQISVNQWLFERIV